MRCTDSLRTHRPGPLTALPNPLRRRHRRRRSLAALQFLGKLSVEQPKEVHSVLRLKTTVETHDGTSVALAHPSSPRA